MQIWVTGFLNQQLLMPSANRNRSVAAKTFTKEEKKN